MADWLKAVASAALFMAGAGASLAVIVFGVLEVAAGNWILGPLVILVALSVTAGSLCYFLERQ